MGYSASVQVAMDASVQLGFSAPSFSYHMISEDHLLAPRISISPSPSTSAAWTPCAASRVNSSEPQPDPSPLLFSYQAMTSASGHADNTSKSPSPSTSAVKTLLHPERTPAIPTEVFV